MSVTKKVPAKKAVTTSKSTASKKPSATAVKNAAKETTVKQLSEYDKKMAAITLRQEQEAFGLAYCKELEAETKKRPGVILSILNFISESKLPVTQRQVLEHLKAEFPKREEKSMTNTIKAQIGGKKRPLRMEREKRVIFAVVENKSGVKTYALDFVEAPADAKA